MLVTRVIGDCPGCGARMAYGNVQIRADHVLRGCKACKYSAHLPLPPVHKKVLYLDQFFFSSAFKERDARFVEAAERILDVSAHQLIVAPFSSVHEDETHQWRGYGGKDKDDLMEFIKATSRGHEFEPAYEVEEAQLATALDAFLKGAASSFVVERSDAIEDSIHEWDDYFRIDVGRYMGDIELKRGLKAQAAEQLVDLFPDWRKSTNTFEQDVELETRQGAREYVVAYARYAARLAAGDVAALLDSPIKSQVVQSLLHYFPEVAPEDALRKLGEFFKSDHFAEAAYQWISARMFAVLKDQVKRGAYQQRDDAIQRLRGVFDDITHISTYAPYCDAFVMDRSMAGVVSDPRIALTQRYGVKVFSLTNWDEMLAWLEQLKAQMSEDHRLGLQAAYL